MLVITIHLLQRFRKKIVHILLILLDTKDGEAAKAIHKLAVSHFFCVEATARRFNE